MSSPNQAPADLATVERWHSLKTWPRHFEAIAARRKTVEIRINDRRYREGDGLVLAEWDPDRTTYTGRGLLVVVGHVLTWDQCPGKGLYVGFAALSIVVVSKVNITPAGEIDREKPADW